MVGTEVTNQTRLLTRHSPCPICQGYDKMKCEQGERWSGFSRTYGKYTVCTREEYAGQLEQVNSQPPGYQHKLHEERGHPNDH